MGVAVACAEGDNDDGERGGGDDDEEEAAASCLYVFAVSVLATCLSPVPSSFLILRSLP